MTEAISEMSASGASSRQEQVSGEQLTTTLHDRYQELLEGAPAGEPTWVTTGGPGGGAYGTVEGLTANQASMAIDGTTLAAHTEHLRWALQLVNDYFDGKEPTSDWSASWQVKEVDDAAWSQLQASLRATGERLLANIRARQRWNDEMAMTAAFASYGHTAYHLGALRQLWKRVEGRQEHE